MREENKLKVIKSKFFHPAWERVNQAMGKVVAEADTEPTGDDITGKWTDACNELQDEVEKLKSLGWSVRHGHTDEEGVGNNE